MKRLLASFHHLPAWLILTLIGVIILRVPSLFEPYYYGDEMIYLTLGQGLRNGLAFYRDLHDNKPPVLYLLAGLSGNLSLFKTLLAGWSLATIVIYWQFLKKILKNSQVIIVSTILFAVLTTIPLFEGNIANAENFFIGPIILSFSLLWSPVITTKKLFWAGFLFGLASLIKVPAAFDMLAVFAFWLITYGLNRKGVIKTIRQIIIFSIGFLLPVVVIFVYYTSIGAFSEYLIAAYLQNFGYVSSWKRSVVQESFLVKNWPLILRFLLAVIGAVGLYWQRKKLSPTFIFTCLWLLFSLFAVTLSERPYPHYFLQAVPAVAILLGYLVADKTKLQTLSIIPLSLAFLVPVVFRFWYYPTSTYYTRFLAFATRQINYTGYLKSFDSNLPNFYQIATYLNQETTRRDKIFVWGDAPVVYALSQRQPPIKYVAGYHINDFYTWTETLKDLRVQVPKMIILDTHSSHLEIVSFLKERYGFVTQFGDWQIWKLITKK